MANYNYNAYKYTKYKNYKTKEDVVDDFTEMIQNEDHPYHASYNSVIRGYTPYDIYDYLDALGYDASYYDSLPSQRDFYESLRLANECANQKMSSIEMVLRSKAGPGRPIADMYIFESPETVKSKCRNFLGKDADYQGCTYQNGFKTSESYNRPQSITYLSNQIDPAFMEQFIDHENGHQSILTVKQMIENDFSNLCSKNKNLNYNQLRLSDVYKDILKLNEDIDDIDDAYIDSYSGKGQIRKSSDVGPLLDDLVIRYLEMTKNYR